MPRPLSIILLCYNDERVLQAIKSIRRFDDAEAARIVVVDGGSKQDLVDRIGGFLDSEDILVSEKDDGIFDALNKGLHLSPGPYIGWLGSDDIYSEDVNSSSVIAALEHSDLFIGSTLHVFGNRVLRRTPSWPAGLGLVNWGLNNPHFSTFGRKDVLAATQFDPRHPAADIGYFLRVFATRPRVQLDHKNFTIMQAYGASNSSLRTMLHNNLRLFRDYRDNANILVAAAAFLLKGSTKTMNVLYYKIRQQRWLDPLLQMPPAA